MKGSRMRFSRKWFLSWSGIGRRIALRGYRGTGTLGLLSSRPCLRNFWHSVSLERLPNVDCNLERAIIVDLVLFVYEPEGENSRSRQSTRGRGECQPGIQYVPVLKIGDVQVPITYDSSSRPIFPLNITSGIPGRSPENLTIIFEYNT
jgi:hypothetical protein